MGAPAQCRGPLRYQEPHLLHGGRALQMASEVFTLVVLFLVCSTDSTIHKEVTRIQAFHDQAVVLPCYVPSLQCAEWFSLYWFRRWRGHSRLVNVYRSSPSSYRPTWELCLNRTQLDPERVHRGDASLGIPHIRVSDAGLYTCCALVNNKTIEIQDVKLEVSAPYSRPEITVLRLGPSLLLQCRSHGGFPRASLQWNDGHRHLLDTLNNLQVQNSLGLYNLQSHALLEPARDQTVCCSISNKALHSTNTACTSLRGCHEYSSGGSCRFLHWVLLLLLGIMLIALLRGCRRKQASKRTLDISVLEGGLKQ